MKCNRCGATWALPASANSQDSQLDALLQAVVAAADDTGPGVCQLGDTGRIVAVGVANSRQYHADRLTAVQAAMEAVHAHIQQHYEED